MCALYHGRIARLTEYDDVIKLLLRGAPRLGLALGPAPGRADPARKDSGKTKNSEISSNLSK